MVSPARFADLQQPLDFVGQAWAYWLDAGQRSILFWDVLRQRGNNYLEHRAQGKPPVLAFDYDILVDGRELDRPVNYALLIIHPKPGMEINPKKRPMVIVDPRAGHGPGIGGSKGDSQVGMAMQAGHPVYFVTFFRMPEPGQTIMDVAEAEALFLEEVARRHPESHKPCVIGNCQAGWAVAMLAAARPEVTGPLLINGAPMSYWAGVPGKNPMRYTGGLLGGVWLSNLASDLGNGKFDGAHLVANFENLKPANTFWGKQYNLYANIDTETERYLNFEKWWGGFYLLNAEEMHFIVDNLFIGNKLQHGLIELEDGQVIDLKNIQEPMVLFASGGDNITPPQQALNWIADVYDSAEEIKLHHQVIVYLLHEEIGHLGIFVSGKIAQKEHAELISSLNTIDLLLPPGLYEMVIDEKQPGDENIDLILRDYKVHFEERTIADLHAATETEDDRHFFENVAAVSQFNNQLYQAFVSPWIKFWMTEPLAETLRWLHPKRVERYMISDLNPCYWGLEPLASIVRANRQPVSENNLYHILEAFFSNCVELGLDFYQEIRDRNEEFLFRSVYGPHNWLLPLVFPYQEAACSRAVQREHDAEMAAMLRTEKAALLDCIEEGGLAEAIVRMLVAVMHAEKVLHRRQFAVGSRLWESHDKLKNMPIEQYEQILRDQSFIVQLDQERAINALPKLLPKASERLEALEYVSKTMTAAGPLGDEGQAVLEQIEQALNLPALV